MIWHILDVRSIWVKEFASALAAQVPTLSWCPRITSMGRLRNMEKEAILDDPLLTIRYFPLQRGFARFPVSAMAQEGKRITRRLLELSDNPATSTLICSAPHYATVAEFWPGPVVYYVTDLFSRYGNEPSFIDGLDATMCKAATLVCPNSHRIADYLTGKMLCPADKVIVIPNAMRRTSVFATLPNQVGDLPIDIADLPRPIAGVLGNLGGNTDWTLLRETINRTPWLSWVFVGPTSPEAVEVNVIRTMRHLMRHEGRIRFVGVKPYGELKHYARSFDVAILPYRKIEPTYSGSSTRFYEHLAACRPMVATAGCAELLSKGAVLWLINDSDEMTSALEDLRRRRFRDDREELRWKASQQETWDERASQMIAGLSRKVALAREAAA